MAHFAKLGTGNIVEEIIVVSNDIATTEQDGINFLRNLYKDQHLPVIQTSYNTYGGVHNNNGTPLRKNYAGIGFKYDQQRDAFIAPKPFNSWILNEDTCIWEAPVSYPQDNNRYTWNESIINWEIKTT
jgi:hypothetical protein